MYLHAYQYVRQNNMPIYQFINDDTHEIKEIFQNMDQPHQYMDERNKEWRRLFTAPQLADSILTDPFNQQQFIDKTGRGKGTMGDVYERSAELSQARADKAGGLDPKKEQYYKDYAGKRLGKKHPKQIIEQANKTFNV